MTYDHLISIQTRALSKARSILNVQNSSVKRLSILQGRGNVMFKVEVGVVAS